MEPRVSSYCLVCGLGSLGQRCVAVLKSFGMQISAVDLSPPKSWEVQNLPELLEDLVIGDCRQPRVLQQAQVDRCRAVLMVTDNERINIEAAFAVRLIHPQVRLIVRSSEQNLNQLLDQQLGNFAALEITDLPASALAIAALADETQGLISVGQQLLRVVHCAIDSNHRWCDRRLLYELNSRTRRVLNHRSQTTELSTQFYQWNPNAPIQAGDWITYIEITQESIGQTSVPKRQKSLGQHWRNWQRQLSQFDRNQIPIGIQQLFTQHSTRRLALLVGLTVLILVMIGTMLLKATHFQQSWLQSLYVASVMLLGSYDTVFGALSTDDPIPLWMRFLNLGYMLTGTASIAILYALLTESLLAAKFQLLHKRPPIPQQNHVVLIGLERVGRQVARVLQTLNQSMVGVSDSALEPSVLPHMPLVVRDFHDALANVNLAAAKSVVVATDNEMANLEIGLMAHAINPDAALVIQTFDPDFSQNIDHLLPYARVLCSYSLAAEAFAAAVFGDHILDLLRLQNQTMLVVEYQVQPDDHLQGLFLDEVAYGYGVLPIFYQNAAQVLPLPPDNTKLQTGDRLIVLATVESLQQIDRGEPLPRKWQVSIQSRTASMAFESARTVTRITGCSLSIATQLMEQVPSVLPLPLYRHQALRLVRELSKTQSQAALIPYSDVPSE